MQGAHFRDCLHRCPRELANHFADFCFGVLENGCWDFEDRGSAATQCCCHRDLCCCQSCVGYHSSLVLPVPIPLQTPCYDRFLPAAACCHRLIWTEWLHDFRGFTGAVILWGLETFGDLVARVLSQNVTGFRRCHWCNWCHGAAGGAPAVAHYCRSSVEITFH